MRISSPDFKKREEGPSLPQEQCTDPCMQSTRNHHPKLLFFSSELLFKTILPKRRREQIYELGDLLIYIAAFNLLKCLKDCNPSVNEVILSHFGFVLF